MAITTRLPSLNQPIAAQAIGVSLPTVYKHKQRERLSQLMPISVAEQPNKAASTNRFGLI